MNFWAYMAKLVKQAKEWNELFILGIGLIFLFAAGFCRFANLPNPVEDFISESKLEKLLEFGGGIFIAIWCLVWLPYRTHEKQAKEFVSRQKEIVTQYEKSLAQERDKTIAFQTEVSRLNKWIQDESAKLTIEPSVAVVNSSPLHQLTVTVKVVNEGKNAVVIDRVYIDQKTHITIYPLNISRDQSAEWPFPNPESNKPLRLETAGLHRYVTTVSDYTGIIAVQSDDGKKRLGTGCVVMANGAKHKFVFELSPDFIA